jgi:hypothetical protein
MAKKKKKYSRPYIRRKQRPPGATGPDIPMRLEDGQLNPEYGDYLVHRLGFMIRCTLEVTDKVEMTFPTDEDAARMKLTPEEARGLFLRAMKNYRMKEVSPGKWANDF